jgi:hypothetical protein
MNKSLLVTSTCGARVIRIPDSVVLTFEAAICIQPDPGDSKYIEHLERISRMLPAQAEEGETRISIWFDSTNMQQQSLRQYLPPFFEDMMSYNTSLHLRMLADEESWYFFVASTDMRGSEFMLYERRKEYITAGSQLTSMISDELKSGTRHINLWEMVTTLARDHCPFLNSEHYEVLR